MRPGQCKKIAPKTCLYVLIVKRLILTVKLISTIVIEMDYIKINDLFIYNRNRHEAQEIYNSIFLRGDYASQIDNSSPKIIDCGAHIGLATIYFKKKFPLAKITAIEANPETLKCLDKNITVNNIQDVKIIWGALSKESGMIPLYIDPDTIQPWSWDDSIMQDIWSNRLSRKTKKITNVPSIHLSGLINKKVDLLKVDIEGAECEVIEEVGEKLNFVKTIIMEFHPTEETPLSHLERIRKIFQNHNFKIREYPVDWAIFLNATKG